MKRTVAIATIAATVTLAGCGGEDLTESIIENRIEAETGEDVDIDLSDGDVSIKTENGEISYSIDEDGNVSVEGVDEDGNDFSVQSDDGVTRIETDEGDATITNDGDQTVFESEDGSATFTSGAELPDDFPADVPVPQGMTIDAAQAMATGGSTAFVLIGMATGDVGDYTDRLVADLEAAGFTQQQLTTTADSAFLVYERADFVVSATASSNGDGTLGVSYQVAPVE